MDWKKMNKTKIEWTNYSWNPITGCKHGCWYCYAKKLFTRFHKSFEPTFHPERLKEPYDLKKPSKIFVCSVADLFAPWTPIEWTNQVFKSMIDCPINHQWQLLTKNPERIPRHPYPMNWWIGSTVTEESEAWKIDVIRNLGCGVRFISFEPLLGQIRPDLENVDWVIIGKLTGSKKVKLHRDWVTSILAECEFHNIPVFLKNNLGYGKLTQEFPKVNEKNV